MTARPEHLTRYFGRIIEATVVSERDVIAGQHRCHGTRSSTNEITGCSYWAQKEVTYKNGVVKYYCGSHYQGIEPDYDD